MAAFTNQAMLSYNGITTVSNTVTGEIIGALSINKTPLADNYSVDESITYSISLINSGEAAIESLTITDNLGAYETPGGASVIPLTYKEGSAALFINGVIQPTPSIVTTSPLEFGNISLPGGSNAVLIYTTIVNSFAPLAAGSSISNTVDASSPSISNPLSDTAVLHVSDTPELSITKAISPAKVIENGTLTYTFVIENTGNTDADATYDLVLTDTFSPVLSGITVQLDGAALAAPTEYSYDELTGEFATVAGVVTVPAASFIQNPDGSTSIIPGSVTLTVSGTVR